PTSYPTKPDCVEASVSSSRSLSPHRGARGSLAQERPGGVAMAVAQVESRVTGAMPGVRAAHRKGDEVNGGLKIGQLAQQVGVTAKAIRFYEAKRVLPRPARGANGYRLYGQDALKTLTFVKRAAGLGLTLAEIRDIIAIRQGGAPPCVHVRRLLQD